ncbi:hypothetical protein SDC9_77370 [bioreactor metagenome]|uniref:Uncharacterized protein n=1 Tax=bioreactor metagenome TaxID=1076179 RepID=A0A644YQR0_9ZZZZ
MKIGADAKVRMRVDDARQDVLAGNVYAFPGGEHAVRQRGDLSALNIEVRGDDARLRDDDSSAKQREIGGCEPRSGYSNCWCGRGGRRNRPRKVCAVNVLLHFGKIPFRNRLWRHSRAAEDLQIGLKSFYHHTDVGVVYNSV